VLGNNGLSSRIPVSISVLFQPRLVGCNDGSSGMCLQPHHEHASTALNRLTSSDLRRMHRTNHYGDDGWHADGLFSTEIHARGLLTLELWKDMWPIFLFMSHSNCELCLDSPERGVLAL